MYANKGKRGRVEMTSSWRVEFDETPCSSPSPTRSQPSSLSRTRFPQLQAIKVKCICSICHLVIIDYRSTVYISSKSRCSRVWEALTSVKNVVFQPLSSHFLAGTGF